MNASVMDNYEIVIGLEVHCQLMTQTKIFSSASTMYGAEPNSQVCEVDLGLPGALPVLNRHAVSLAMKAGLALGCTINRWSQFARKNYFYPDLPKGYQISQHEHPICSEGAVEIELDGQPNKRVEIERIHMEEDAGKSSHLSGHPYSLINLNRAGVPLIEIVSRPDMRSADEAVAYLKALHAVVVYLGVCDGNMEEGSFRCDANVSVRPKGQEVLGTRTELKNINSFKFVRDAINYEARRQVALLERGESVIQQTRLYNPDKGETFAMRDKEESHDYRYFPCPDLPPLIIDDAWYDGIVSSMPELPAQKYERYQTQWGLSQKDAGVLSSDRGLIEFFEAAAELHPENIKGLANWTINELLREVKLGDDDAFGQVAITPQHLAALVRMIDEERISGKIAKNVFAKMLEDGQMPEVIVEANGWQLISDPEQLGQIIDELMAKHEDKVKQFRAGKVKLRGFFVGQAMKATGGQGNPRVLNAVLDQKLNQD